MTYNRARTLSASSPRWHCSKGVWYLTRAGRDIAVIEPSGDDYSWFLIGFDHDGEPVFAGAWRHVVTLKASLLIWARRNTGYLVGRCARQPLSISGSSRSNQHEEAPL